MIDPALIAAMQAFDDKALATLANPGLLRRAQRDLADGKVVLEASEGGNARLAVDGQAVEIGAAGPAKGRCDCSAAGVCRHLLGAVLLLRESAVEEVEGEIASVADPLEIIAAIPLEEARKFTGRPGWRAALELLETAGEVEPGGTSVAVRFDELDEPVLILRGQGMAEIVSGASKAQKKAYHAAALLAARRHFGLSLESADAEEQAAAPTTSAPDPQFLARVQRALVDCAALGFNLAPLPLEESLFALSVSSRADALPRLASLLRSIAAQMRLRRQRSFSFDAGLMLELMATAHALSRAVAKADPADPHFATLAGQVRREYQPLGDVELVGCGAEIWRTKGGARGVTVHLLDEGSGRFHAISLARGAGQEPLFDPRNAFYQQAVWQAGPLAELAHARIALTGAGVAADGRLSAGQDVRARLVDKAALPSAAHGHADWEAMRAALAGGFALGLAATGQPQMVLLHPTDTARPSFDELAQRLIWPLRDAEGRWLAVMLDHDVRGSTAIENLQMALGRGWRGTVLAKATLAGESVELAPVSLLGDGEPADLTVPPQHWARNKDRDLRSWLLRLRPDPGRNLQFIQPSASSRAIADAWRNLLDRLEAGPQLASLLEGKRAAHAARLGDYGMTRLAELISIAQDGEALLAAGYALLVARQQRLGLSYLA